MKKREMKIDINKLNDKQLEQLAAMFYELGKTSETKEINNRISFLRGWMSEKVEEEYYEMYCKE